MRIKAALLVIMIASITISGCAKTAGKTGERCELQTDVVAEEASFDATDISEATGMDASLSNTERAMILLDDLYNSNNSNVVFSPMSLNFSLGMINNGSNDEIHEKLNTYLNDKDFNDTALKILSKYRRNTDEKNVFCIADSVWVSDDKTISQDFRQITEGFYGAETHLMDVSDPQESADAINSWCDEKTEHLIPEIIKIDNITPDTSTVLLNTVYLNAEWKNKWNETECDFSDVNGQKSIQKMFTGEVEKYYKNDKAIGFGTYYKNGLEFIGILPENESEENLDFKTADLDIDSLLDSGCFTRDTDKEVVVKIPSFKYSTDNKCLKQSLITQGLEDIFDSGKNPLSRLLEDGDETYISDIIQKCTIDVNKNGTEASAATATITKTNSFEVASEKKETIEINLDRPFLYLIVEPETKQIVFSGKVVNTDNFTSSSEK